MLSVAPWPSLTLVPKGLLVLVPDLIPPSMTLLLASMSMTLGPPGLIIQAMISTSATLGSRHGSRWPGDSISMLIVGGRDHILERLLIEGTFDWEETSVDNMAEEYAVQHVSAIGLCLLIHIEDVEHRVHGDCFAFLFRC
jgi:hypothetical protein